MSLLLSKYCPDVEVLAQCSSTTAAMQAIGKFHPDLVFLDIQMPGMNGFELLENCQEYGFKVIFTTAFNEYAIQAIRHSALDYLLKPVNKNELIQAVAKAKAVQQPTASERIARLLESIESRKTPERVALTTFDGMIIIENRDILYCESENNYTRFHLVSGKTVLISKTLKKVEELFAGESDFLRIHNSFIINIRYVQRYLKGDGGEIYLTTGKSLPVSRTKKQEFLSRLEKL